MRRDEFPIRRKKRDGSKTKPISMKARKAFADAFMAKLEEMSAEAKANAARLNADLDAEAKAHL